MEELKHSYELLGLEETATREEVENRYFLLMKRAKSSGTDLSEVTQAYNRIVGIESEKENKTEKQGKVAYFFYYYKIHLIVAIIAVLLIGGTVKSMVDKHNANAKLPPVDVALDLFGGFYQADTERLEQNVLTAAPEWKRVKTTLTYVPAEMKSQQDMALQQKSFLTLMTEKMDIMILDTKNFENLANQQAFKPLEDWEDWLASSRISAERLVAFKAEEDETAHPYGIKLSGSTFFEGTGLPKQSYIIAVRATAAHPEEAKKLLVLLARSEPDA
ncbi:hypothetical protein ACFPVX_14695 [Cohnella faecalis]|uniref:J domain-containing protein n=1 Tax=Cohnella faecalis TaxID=2315694 RepID=A0A398CRU2_9BACL|nr:hypothetical protein [Cohnella faecalis]RIE02507.1 hypothetical protein D3H35_17610 [Cohnella faecalis]